MSTEGLRFEYTTGWIPVSDPPKKPGWYLVDNPAWNSEMTCEWGSNRWLPAIMPTHWRELPPRAPKPDAFEVWWQSWPEVGSDTYREIGQGNIVGRATALVIWDAAMKAKEGK